MAISLKVGDKIRHELDGSGKKISGKVEAIVVIVESETKVYVDNYKLGSNFEDKVCSRWYIDPTSTAGELTKLNGQGLMAKLNSMLKRLLDDDSKKLYKAGFIDGELKLTDEGQEMLMAIAFDTHKADLVKAAEEVIAEAKDEK